MSVSCCTIALYTHCTYTVQTCLYTFMSGGQDSRCEICTFLIIIWIVAIPDIGVYADIGSHIGAHDTISGFSCDPISGHVSCVPISDPIFRGLVPISGVLRYRDIMSPISLLLVPDIGFNIGTNIGYPISGLVKPDIGVNIGYNIGLPDIGV